MDIKKQQKTSLFDALKKYLKDETISFHVPGHKGGKGLKEFRDFVGEHILNIDVTGGIIGLDNICNPIGVIKEAQDIAADAFGANYAHFLVNGTTSGIQAMILSVARPGDEIIIPRNAHRSVVGALILSGAKPVYINPVINEDMGIAMGITPESVRKALIKHPKAKAVFVINPTYYGACSNLKEIVRIAHSFGKPVLVDEAHGAHFGFCEKLPLSAMEAGADISSASAHKLIGSMTQSSILLVKSDLIENQKIKTALNLTQTTSPSYPLMASLDLARKQMAFFGDKMLKKTIKLCEKTRENLNKIDDIYVLGRDVEGTEGCYAYDPTKLVINFKKLGLTGFEVEKILKYNYKIQVELSDLYNILAIGSIGDDNVSFKALENAIKDIADKYHEKNVTKISFKLPENLEQITSPRYAFYSKKYKIPLEKAEGKISAEMLMAYPPGIPIICPGELITDNVIQYIKTLKNQDCHLQGTEDPKANMIKVIDENDLRSKRKYWEVI